MSSIANPLRKNAYSARAAAVWRLNLCTLTGCLALSSSAWAMRVDLIGPDSSRYSVAEGNTLRLKVRASADSFDELAPQTQCVATGRVVTRSVSDTTPVEGEDYTLEGQNFSIQFTYAPTEQNPNGSYGESDFSIIALKDKVVDAGEVFQISSEDVVVNCGGENSYGGVITPYVSFMSYGPQVEITDSTPEVDYEVEKLALLPELESMTVLTMSGAQARNKTLAKQMDFARQKAGPNNRVSLKLDGADIPVAGGSAGDDFSPWGLFVSGDFERGDRELASADSFDFTTNTVMAGVDYRANNSFIVGAAISGSQGKAEQNNRPDETELSQSALSVFGSFYTENFYLDSMFTYGNNQYDMVRSVLDGAVVKSLANAGTDGSETSFGVGAGYQFDFKTSLLKLFTRLDYVNVDVDSYAEYSGDETMLVAKINDFAIKSFTSNLGASYTWIINTGFGVLSPEIGVDYEHQFKGDGFNVDGQFIGGEAGEFSISTYDKDANYFNGNLALNAVFAQGMSAYLGYTGQFGRDKWSSDHYALGARLEF